MSSPTFTERVLLRAADMTPVERRIVDFLRRHPEEALVASAAVIAARVGTSDASVVRTARTLGFSGLADLRRCLADEIRAERTPAARLERTLEATGDDPLAVFGSVVDLHRESLEALRRDVTPDMVRTATGLIGAAARLVVFGIGPSSALADYAVRQFRRFGQGAEAMTETGLLLADELLRLHAGDVLLVLAYGRVYRELDVLLERARRLDLPVILVTDTLAPDLRDRVRLVLPVARGRADMVSLHTATLGLIEALMVTLAASRGEATLASLRDLNDLRVRLAGNDVRLPERGR